MLTPLSRAAEPEFDATHFRAALSRFATGVTIITTRDESGGFFGLTASSFNSVSLTPPLVLWSLSLRSPNLPNFLQATHFAINVLARDQINLSQRFSKPIPNKFEGVACSEGHERLPLLDGAAAQFQCRTEARHYAGDHVIFIGHVIQYVHSEREALGYFRGRYAAMNAIDPA